jgi:hypothetical protein
MFCRYPMWYISLLLAAGSISKKKSDKGLPVIPRLMFRKFLILCPFFRFLIALIPASLSVVDF